MTEPQNTPPSGERPQEDVAAMPEGFTDRAAWDAIHYQFSGGGLMDQAVIDWQRANQERVRAATDVAAQVERVAVEHRHRTHGGRVNFIQECETCAALDSLAAHIAEQDRSRKVIYTELQAHIEQIERDLAFNQVAANRLQELAEAAERERDELLRDLVSRPSERERVEAAERRVEALEAALRRIAEGAESNPPSDVAGVARRALAEIEESEPYANVPGAGQRGC